MILTDLEKKIEEFRQNQEKKFGHLGPNHYPQTKIERKQFKPVLNLLEDFIENYNSQYFYFYEQMVFLPPNERIHIDGYVVFAENVGSNLYYVYNPNEEGRVFCINIDDGEYVWEVAKNYDSFFRLLIEFLNMKMEPTLELTDDEYKVYYNKCMEIVGGDKDLEQYIKFMCCIG